MSTKPTQKGFGPWVTAFDTEPRAALDTFWQRRMAMLPRLENSTFQPTWRRQSFAVILLAFSLVAPALQLSPVKAVQAGDEPPDVKSVPDAKDWERKKRLTIPTGKRADSDIYKVWVQDHWLHVERRTATGVLDWHVVLARELHGEAPSINDPSTQAGSLRVSYAGGRYFVREDGTVLNILLERDGNPGLPDGLLPETRKRVSRSVSPTTVLEGWNADGWHSVDGGARDHSSFVVRLCPVAKSGDSTGAQGLGQAHRQWWGEHSLTFDGELLVAFRMLEWDYTRELRRAQLLGHPLPDIAGRDWLNTQRPLSRADLAGKVVLLDFWAGWCGPCMEKLPKVQALYEKYRDRGLVVIGVHAPFGAENYAEVARQNKLSFPIVVGSDQTDANFAIDSYPSYILVGKDGKIAAPADNQPPTEKQIEKLLNISSRR